MWDGILNKDKLIKHIAELIIENDENIIFALKTHDREWLEKIIKEYVGVMCLFQKILNGFGYYKIEQLKAGGHCGLCGKWKADMIVLKGWAWGICDDCLNKENLCPHGYEDWDDCPDCRH